MSALLLWLGMSTCLAAGHWAAHRALIALDVADLAACATGVVAASLVGGCLCLVWTIAWPGRASRWRTGVLLVLCGGLAWVHGASGTTVDDVVPSIRGHDRSPVEGVRELVVSGASAPGTWCSVVAREPESRLTMLLRAPATACPLAQGQRIRVLTRELVPVGGPQLPGDLDPTVHARAQGASFTAHIEHLWSAGGKPSRYWQGVARLRHWGFEQARGRDSLGFLAAATLGVRTALPPQRRVTLRNAGLGHLVAVSGVHVGIAAWLVYVVILRLAVGLGSSVAVGVVASWIPIVLYVGITGAAPPAVRAAVMVMLMGLSVLVGRPSHGLVILAVAATMLLAYRPSWAFDAGFQLSLAAMAVLVRQSRAVGWIATSWRVAWAVAPVSLLHFGEACFIGVIANTLAIPVFALWVLPLGLLGWLAAPWLGVAALFPASWGATLLLDWAQFVAGLPTIPTGWEVVFALLALVLRWIGMPRWPTARWHGFVPPWLASLGLLGAIAHAHVTTPAPAPSGTWFVLGGSVAPSVLQMKEDGEACLADPRWTAQRWQSIVRALGIRRLRLRDAHEPHLRALIETLRRAGHSVLIDDECELPSRRAARSAIRGCQEGNPRGCGAARVDPTEHRLLCHCEGVWRTHRPIQWTESWEHSTPSHN